MNYGFTESDKTDIPGAVDAYNGLMLDFRSNKYEINRVYANSNARPLHERLSILVYAVASYEKAVLAGYAAGAQNMLACLSRGFDYSRPIKTQSI